MIQKDTDNYEPSIPTMWSRATPPPSFRGCSLLCCGEKGVLTSVLAN